MCLMQYGNYPVTRSKRSALLGIGLERGTLTVPSAEPLANVSSVVGQKDSAVTAALWPLNVCLSFQP